MLKLELFTGTKTYMFPNGAIATPQKIRENFPAVDVFPHVIEANGDVCQAVMNLSAMRAIHNIDSLLTDEDAVLAIETIINTPPVEVISAEERLAAAAEFSNIMLLDDVVVTQTPLTTEQPLGGEMMMMSMSSLESSATLAPHAMLIKQNFDKGLWSKQMIDKAVLKGVITAEECTTITGV